MRAAILRAPLDLRYERVPVPAFSDRDILVRVRAALTCGTDQKAYLRGHPKISIPGPLGHEFSGEVAAVGRRVRNIRVGDRVVSVHTGPCGKCFYCRRGETNLCETLTDRMAYGAYAEYIRIPEHVHRQNCLALPPKMSYETAALTEPLACCIFGVKRVNLQKGETVVILGDGPVGFMFAALCKKRKARRIALIGKYPARLRAAASAGAHVTYRMDVTDRKLLQSFGPRGPDVVIECVGRPETWKRAVGLVRPGGRVLLFGGCLPGEDVSFNAGKIHYGNISIFGAFHFTPLEVRESLSFLKGGGISSDVLISDRVPLSDIGRYFSPDGRKDYLKIAFIP